MVKLGLGKNMVRALRFWLEVTDVAEPEPGGAFALRPFGRAVFAPGKGLDPFLEDPRTLWLLHWNIATQRAPLYAWDYLLNRWQQPEFSRSEVLAVFLRETAQNARPLSDVTLGQHFDIFVHSYVPSQGRGPSGEEDGLECPLADLRLIDEVGERRVGATGRREPVYAFRRVAKPHLTHRVFAYCAWQFWQARFGDDRTLALRELTVGTNSPGRIFELPEDAVREHAEALESVTDGALRFRASAATPAIVREKDPKADRLLRLAYREDATHA